MDSSKFGEPPYTDSTMTQTLEKSRDGTQTKERKILNVSWRDHITNQELYSSLPQYWTIMRQCHLCLEGHVMHHDEVASKVLLWKPSGPWRRGPQIKLFKRSLRRMTGSLGLIHSMPRPTIALSG